MTNIELIQITNSKNKTISIETKLSLVIKKKKRHWIAYSPHFKTFGYSNRNENSAIKDFGRALDLFFDVHIKRGTLEKALIKFGWKKTDNAFEKPKHFNIPLHLLAGKKAKTYPYQLSF